ncbi:hypothetical protein L3X38_043337 [Prunus dulcis]|uniref:Uncharacterized protein n=1 Tax=Prunus dulcis TaxID=3755 RepID=A0AAD4UYD5_PRUDU|nr:hypothetical protein L3X38_043337 [Prunus dulcis]
MRQAPGTPQVQLPSGPSMLAQWQQMLQQWQQLSPESGAPNPAWSSPPYDVVCEFGVSGTPIHDPSNRRRSTKYKVHHTIAVGPNSGGGSQPRAASSGCPKRYQSPESS